MTDERLVESSAKGWLHAESLEYEDTHAHDTLTGRVVFRFHRIVENENDKVVRAVCVNDEAPEAFVALKKFPKEY